MLIVANHAPLRLYLPPLETTTIPCAGLVSARKLACGGDGRDLALRVPIHSSPPPKDAPPAQHTSFAPTSAPNALRVNMCTSHSRAMDAASGSHNATQARWPRVASAALPLPERADDLAPNPTRAIGRWLFPAAGRGRCLPRFAFRTARLFSVHRRTHLRPAHCGGATAQPQHLRPLKTW